MLIHEWQKKQVTLYTKLLHYTACHVKIIKSQGKSKNVQHKVSSVVTPKDKTSEFEPFFERLSRQYGTSNVQGGRPQTWCIKCYTNI